eukprot:scaffold283128_cov33-Tisochrysis_lutea.AAC.3
MERWGIEGRVAKAGAADEVGCVGFEPTRKIFVVVRVDDAIERRRLDLEGRTWPISLTRQHGRLEIVIGARRLPVTRGLAYWSALLGRLWHTRRRWQHVHPKTNGCRGCERDIVSVRRRIGHIGHRVCDA